MADPRSWDDFDVHYPFTGQILHADRGHPSDQDGIAQMREPGTVDRGFLELGLSTSAQITWWKSIRAYTREGNDIGQIAMQDQDHGPRWMRVRTAALSGGRLELEKAATFGVHTGMYRLLFDELPADIRDGARITFDWHRDS
jgi:hypothetical protein